MRDIVVALFKISGHPKITNLQKQTNKQTNKQKKTNKKKKQHNKNTKHKNNTNTNKNNLTLVVLEIKPITSQLYLACCPVLSHQNIPGCQISVYKSFPCQVLHA